MINWIPLADEQQLSDIVKNSYELPQVIFKHSTRCSISSMAKSRLERSTPPENLPMHYLDLIQYRSLSNSIADVLSVHHESPQIILVKNGECVYDESHSGISMDELVDQVNSISK